MDLYVTPALCAAVACCRICIQHLFTRALNLLQLVTRAPQYDREGNVTIKCLQSVTRYDIILQGDVPAR